MFFTLVKARWISTYDQYTKVNCKVPDVYMQYELLRDTRDADGRPSLSTVFHTGVCVNVIHQNLNVLRFHLRNLLRICEN